MKRNVTSIFHGKLPSSIKDWGESCSPPLENPWLSHIQLNLTPTDALSLARLIFPEFVRYKGGYFLESQFSETRFQEWQASGLGVVDIERVMNHAHVYDLFSDQNENAEEDYFNVAKLLQQSWNVSLSLAFPGVRFNVCLSNTDQDYGPTITFSSEEAAP